MSRQDRYPHGYREHHILYTDATYSSQEATRKLRNNQWLKPPIDDESHAALHKAIPTVPLLDHITARYVEADFEPIPGNYFKTVDSLLFAMEAAKHHFHANAVQKQLTALTMMAVDLQRVYIEEGLYHERRAS